jgi:hypothetical protein
MKTSVTFPFCFILVSAAPGLPQPLLIFKELKLHTRSVQSTPENRAVAYLAREVPRWATHNKCYSCHNNGDATRALLAAVRLSYSVPADSLKDTTRWLSRPREWDTNGGKAGYSDKGLARLQFAAALVDARAAGLVKDSQAVRQAAELVAEGQYSDGTWRVDAEGTIGSPATYGTFLATWQARRVLQQADPMHYRTAVLKANDWFRKASVTTVLDAAAELLALDTMTGKEVAAQQRRALELIRKGEAAQGGWGPYVNSPPEPFDTAAVLLGLARLPDQAAAKPLRQRGRAYLVATQRPDGSWPETTRPAGSVSYAQRLSTTGWAALALFETPQSAGAGDL